MEASNVIKPCDEMELRDTVVSVNLDHIAHNMRQIRALCGSETSIMPVIKANGYGHGAVGIASTLMENGASCLAVATLTEALELREAHPTYPLFILGHTPDRLLPLAAEKEITLTTFTLKQALLLEQWACERNTKVKVHLKVDTGFHRLGTDDTLTLAKICALPHLEAEGIFSHLALVNDQENEKQYRRLCSVIDELENLGFTFRYRHICDSISAVDDPQYHMNMIRPGALIYGLKGFHKGNINVRQAMTFKTKISQIRSVSQGEGVGYDYLWKAPVDTRIGTVPFGYADGYPRSLRDKGYVTIRGMKCPIIGVICMDQCMVDLTKVPDACEGDTAIIYGDGSENTMSIEEAAALAQTNKNEIVARITARPPRVYTSGKISKKGT